MSGGVSKKHKYQKFSTPLESGIPGFKSWRSHVLVERPWSSDLKLLSFNFLGHKVGTHSCSHGGFESWMR